MAATPHSRPRGIGVSFADSTDLRGQIVDRVTEAEGRLEGPFAAGATVPLATSTKRRSA